MPLLRPSIPACGGGAHHGQGVQLRGIWAVAQGCCPAWRLGAAKLAAAEDIILCIHAQGRLQHSPGDVTALMYSPCRALAEGQASPCDRTTATVGCRGCTATHLACTPANRRAVSICGAAYPLAVRCSPRRAHTRSTKDEFTALVATQTLERCRHGSAGKQRCLRAPWRLSQYRPYFHQCTVLQ